MWGRHHVRRMPSGSSTSARTRFASSSRAAVGRSCLEREMLHLGADVERHGSIPQDKLAAAARLVGSYADAARAAGAVDLEVLITSPGRQAANGNELLDAIRAAPAARPASSAQPKKARLAFAGALGSRLPPTRRLVAVVDVGGGSAQVVVGTRRSGPELAALDRPRLSAPDQQAARHRPARARGGRRRARRGRALSRRARSSRTSPRRSPSAAARARSSGSSAADSAATSSNAHSRCSPRRLPPSSCERFGIDAERVGTLPGRCGDPDRAAVTARDAVAGGARRAARGRPARAHRAPRRGLRTSSSSSSGPSTNTAPFFHFGAPATTSRDRRARTRPRPVRRASERGRPHARPGAPRPAPRARRARGRGRARAVCTVSMQRRAGLVRIA